MDEILVANFMVFHDAVDRGRVRPRDRRRGVGRRPLPAREPGAQAHGVRLDDRLRRLAADARRRRARSVPHRRLQRRDDRARRALPAHPRPRRSSSATPTTSCPTTSGRGCRRSATGPSATTSSPATSRASTRRRSSSAARSSAASSGTAPTSGWSSSPSAARASARRCSRKVVAAYPDAARRVNGLRMIAVAGPRIDPASLDAPDGVEVRAFVPDLYRHLPPATSRSSRAASPRRWSSTAARRPFLYFPLRTTSSSARHVRHRLERYGAGRRMEYEAVAPDAIAARDGRDTRRAGRVPAGRRRRRAPGGGADRAPHLIRREVTCRAADASRVVSVHDDRAPVHGDAPCPPTTRRWPRSASTSWPCAGRTSRPGAPSRRRR